MRDISTLIALCAGLWLTSSGMWDLRGPDEGRYVQVAKELLTRHNWLYLTVHGVPYDQKPPLAFWLFAMILKLSGGEVFSWMLRLPSILAAMATIVMTYVMGYHSFGRRSGLFAGLMLMTFPLFYDNAPTAELNMLFTAAITGSLCAWITRPTGGGSMSVARLVTFWISLACAFFIKGPLALVIVMFVVGWEAWRGRSWLILRSIRPLFGVVGMATLIGGWLYLQHGIYGPEFVKEQVSGETFHRIMAGDHGAPFWYYLPKIFLSILFPWGLLAVPAVIMYLRTPERSCHNVTATPYVACVAFPFLFLCIVNGKRQTYLLPLLPAAAILLSALLDRVIADRIVPKAMRRGGAAFFGAVGVLLGVAGVFFAMRPEYVQTDNIWLSATGVSLLIVSGLAIIIISWWFLRASPYAKNFFYAGVALLLVIAWTNFMVVKPAFDPSKSTRFLSDTLDLELKNRNWGKAPNAAVVGAIGRASKAEYHVYGHYKVQPFSTAEGSLLTSNTAPAPALVLVQSDNKQYPEISTALMETGYTQRRQLVVSKDSLTLFKNPNESRRRAPGETMNFLLLGDTGSGKPQVYNIVREMKTRHLIKPVDAIFLLGDNLYEGHFVTKSLHKLFMSPFAALLSQHIPFFATLGNHDYDMGRLRGELEFPPFNMVGRSYYSLDFGLGSNSLSVFVCDAESLKSGDKEQLQWLAAAVAASQASWKILLLHRPIEATEIDHGPSEELRRLLKPILHEIDVVFSGHNHIYERRKILDGTLHITSGAGGQLTTETLPLDENRAAGYNKLGSFVQMVIGEGCMTLTAWNEKGEAVDSIVLRDRSDEIVFDAVDERNS